MCLTSPERVHFYIVYLAKKIFFIFQIFSVNVSDNMEDDSVTNVLPDILIIQNVHVSSNTCNSFE